jgi:hypothetical protein
MFQYVPRTDGEGYNTPKMHETTHFVRYAERLGPLSQYNTASNEHHHIEGSKRTAKQTSRIHATFDVQLANRYYEDLSVRQVTSLFAANNLLD